MVLVDTSAFLSVLDKDERNHEDAKRIWEELIRQDIPLLCTNYILLETLALLQNRFGIGLVRIFQDNVVPLLHIEWVDESLHRAGLAAVLTANRRQLSLVDCISFETARQFGVNTVFAFDQHFAEQGFSCLT